MARAVSPRRHGCRNRRRIRYIVYNKVANKSIAFLFCLCVQKHGLQRLYQVEYLLLVIVESNADPLDLANKVMERLLSLDFIPFIARLQLVSHLKRALVADRSESLLKGLPG